MSATVLYVAGEDGLFEQTQTPRGKAGATSLVEQAAALRALYNQEPRPRAVAWNQITVNSNLWSVSVACASCGCTCNTGATASERLWDEDRQEK